MLQKKEKERPFPKNGRFDTLQAGDFFQIHPLKNIFMPGVHSGTVFDYLCRSPLRGYYGHAQETIMGGTL